MRRVRGSYSASSFSLCRNKSFSSHQYQSSTRNLIETYQTNRGTVEFNSCRGFFSGTSKAKNDLYRRVAYLGIGGATAALGLLSIESWLDHGFSCHSPTVQAETIDEGHLATPKSTDEGTLRKPKPEELPSEKEICKLTFAPEVPPPIKRKHPALVKVTMNVDIKNIDIDSGHTYEVWTFNGHVPGPFIRAREGDTLKVSLYNGDLSGMQHNLDFHSVSGPGGGAPLLNVESGEKKHGYFKLLYPGLFIYHCAVAPIGVHISNGMYGLILVEPKEGLPPVDKEFYVMQSEYYTAKSLDADAPANKLDIDYQKGLDEIPTHVVFNGRVGAHTDEGVPLQAKKGERIRLYVGNIGPNLVSSFHVIGTIMDKVYREADLINPPARGVQTTLIPAGGAAVVEFVPEVPGIYTIVDHSIFRVEKGAVAFVNVTGEPSPAIYTGSHPPTICPGCKVHPG